MQIDSVAVSSSNHSIAQLALDLGLDYAQTNWAHRDPRRGSDWDHGIPADELWWANYVVQAESLAEARTLLPLFRGEGRAQHFVLVIRGLFPPVEPVLTPRSLQMKATTSALTLPGLGFAVVVTGGKWVNVHAAALAALGCCSTAVRPPVLGGLRVGFTDPADSVWLAGDALGSFMTKPLLQPEPDDIYSADVLIGTAKLKQQLSEQIAVNPERANPPVWTPPGSMLPPVDTSVISPMGFLPYPESRALPLEPTDLGARGELRELDLIALRPHSYLEVDGTRFRGQDWALARRLSLLAVAGVPLLTRDLSGRVKSLLGGLMIDSIASFSPDDSQLLRESKSIALRRAALDSYSPKAVWNTVLGQLGKTLIPLPSVSVVLATRRPEKLESALKQLARQSWDAVEVVVVLHGCEADLPEVLRATEAYPGELQLLSVASDMIFGDVLNVGVRATSGDLVCKMDDDDWYGPHHLRDLVHAKEFSGATLVGSQVEFVYLESLDVTTRRPPLGEQYSDHVAGGTIMLGREDLRQLGGWRPVHRAVDRCLLQSVQAAGGLVYRSHGQNYMMHRHAGGDSHGGHTWNPDDSIFLQSVAEQWDGFRPPPQIGPVPGSPSGSRIDAMRSHFSSTSSPSPLFHTNKPLV